MRPAAASAEEAVGGDKCTPSYKPASNVSQDSRTSLALPAELIKTQLVPEKSLYHYRFRLTRHPGALPVAFKSSMTLPSRSPRDPIRVVADLSIEHVAESIGRRPGAVKALQRRGLAALRRLLERESVARGVSP